MKGQHNGWSNEDSRMTQTSLQRTLLAGIAGGAAMNLVMLLTFRLAGFERILLADIQTVCL